MELLDLPVEVLRMIVEAMCPHCQGVADDSEEQLPFKYWRLTFDNYANLRALSLTSSLLRILALPVLHHRVTVRGWPRDELFPLALYFSRNRDMALNMKELDVAAFRVQSAPNKFSLQDIEAIRDEYARLDPTHPGCDKLRAFSSADGGMDSWGFLQLEEKSALLRSGLIDLLLSRATLITRLRVEYVQGKPLWQYIPPPSFPALDCLELERQQEDYYYQYKGSEIQDLSGVLKGSPNLTYLKFQYGHGFPPDLPLPSIRFLYLIYGMLDYKDVESLAKACPNLESLRYTYSPFSGARPEEPDYDLRGTRFCRALRPLKATLKHLDVELTHRRGQLMGAIDDLTENDALELVCLNALNVYRGPATVADGDLLVNLLPKSIQSLSLDGVPEALYPAILRLADVKEAGFFPNLRYFYYVADSPEPIHKTIEELFGRVGVESREGWLRGWAK